MTIHKRTVITCDRCGQQAPFEGEDAAEVRQLARECGWITRDADFCSTCVDRATHRRDRA